MDVKTDLTAIPVHELLGEFTKIQWLPKGRDKFSVKPLMRSPLALVGFTLLSTISGIANPMHVDPYPFWHDLILGPKVQQVEAYELPPDQIEIIIPQEIIETPKETIPEYLKSFAQDPERIKNTLRWENMMEQVVADTRLKIPESQRSYWVSHMLKIIFIESGGNPEASSGIAFGLTQLKSSTADEIATQYQIQQYDIYKNAWDNVFLGTAHQLNLAKWYGPKLAVWTHHLGMGNMNMALRTYLVSNLKLPISVVDGLFNDSNKLSQTIKEYDITPQVLLDSPAVTAQLKLIGAWGDQTWEYYDRYESAGVGMGLKNIA